MSMYLYPCQSTCSTLFCKRHKLIIGNSNCMVLTISFLCRHRQVWIFDQDHQSTPHSKRRIIHSTCGTHICNTVYLLRYIWNIRYKRQRYAQSYSYRYNKERHCSAKWTGSGGENNVRDQSLLSIMNNDLPDCSFLCVGGLPPFTNAGETETVVTISCT